MCGIIFASRAETANKLVLKRYEKQKARGKEGFCFVEIKGGHILSVKRSQDEKDILEKLAKSTADQILFHHRYPTSTPNVVESTHPIFVNNKSLKYNYYVIHNGIITNDTELRDQHIKAGFKYTTDITKQLITAKNTYSEYMWNDSEAFAIDLVQSIESGKDILSEGSIAFIALQYEKSTKKVVSLFWGKNNNPLKIESQKDFFALSSESGKDIKADILYKYDYATEKHSDIKKDIGITYSYQTEFTTGFGRRGIYDDESDFTIPATDDEYTAELQDEITELELELKRLNGADNYDEAFNIEVELDTLRQELVYHKRAKNF